MIDLPCRLIAHSPSSVGRDSDIFTSQSSSLSIIIAPLSNALTALRLRLLWSWNRFWGARILSLPNTNGLKTRSKSDCTLEGPANLLFWWFDPFTGALGLEKNLVIRDCDLFCASFSFRSLSSRAAFFSCFSFSCSTIRSRVPGQSVWRYLRQFFRILRFSRAN